MRIVYKAEKVQRGCIYCLDARKPKYTMRLSDAALCPHERCPYRALDGYRHYSDFLKEEEWRRKICLK